MLSEHRQRYLFKNVEWLTLFLIFCLVIHAVLIYPYIKYLVFDEFILNFKDYVLGVPGELITLLILPFAIWQFVKKRIIGWILVAGWLAISIIFNLFYYYQLFGFLQQGGILLEPDGWIFFKLFELIFFLAVLIYLFSARNRRKFTIKNQAR